ncbi:MAG TPA: M56 family metallopeptidase [Pirellulales bacterium]
MSWLLTLVSVSALFDVAVKSVAVVFLAAALAVLLRRASAAWRHLVWCLSVASLLLLPVLSLLLPDWRVAWLPRWTTQRAQLAATRHTAPPQVERTQPLDDKKIVSSPRAAASKTELHQEPRHLRSVTLETLSPPRAAMPWLTIAWAAGGLLSLVPLAIGLCQLVGLHRCSQAVDDCCWLALVDELRCRLTVRRRVQLRQCRSALAPLTWGALRPVLLLPIEAGAWPDERRRLVLLHELAHVLRWDWLTQLVAHVACAVYWFNPLVWWAARQMRIERERACDDIVLTSGVRASDYARELLALAMGRSDSQVSTLAAVPMARRALLDARLRGILDSRRNRSALSRATVCLGMAITAATITPLAMLRAAPPAREQGTVNREQRTGNGRAAPPDPTQSESAESKKGWPAGSIKTVEMTVNTSRILTIGKPVPRAHVSSPEVAEITALSPTQIQVMAKTPGMTQINLFDEDDNVYAVDVVIDPDAREFRLLRSQQQIAELNESRAEPVQTLELTVNTSRILTIGKQVPRVYVTDPEVIEITALSSTDIRVIAKKPGMTQVNLFDEHDNVYTVDTIVYPDARELRLSLRKQVPMDVDSVSWQQVEKADEPKPPGLGDAKVNEVWNLTLENRPHSHNLLPEGDMESLPRMWKAGWRLFQHSQPNMVGSGELSVDRQHAGKASFHLSVKRRDEEASSPVIETAPLWLSSPALGVEAGQWVRIHGWVNIPQPITGSLDGLLIIESLGREAQAERIGATNGWQEFTLYRAAPAACDLTVTFALSGLGDAWIDDVTVKLVAPPGSIARQVEKVDDVPRASDPLTLVNPEVQEIWDLTLQEAVRTALANSKTLRNMGGLLVTPVVPETKRKIFAGHGTGGSVRESNAVRSTDVCFVLARTNNDTTLPDFRAGVRAMLSDVERAYWDLYFNYRSLNAGQVGRDSALANWRKVYALYMAGSKGGDDEKETQAREQYFLFRTQVENSLGALYTAESRLRSVMGVAPTDRRLIRPTDEPTTDEVRFELKEILAEGLNGDVERSHDQEAKFVQVLTNAVRDLDRNYQVSITMGNRRESATKQLEVVQSAYDAGTATLDMLFDAQRRLADAEIAYYRALVDFNVAIMQVHFRKNTLLEYNGILLTEGGSAGSDVREK